MAVTAHRRAGIAGPALALAAALALAVALAALAPPARAVAPAQAIAVLNAERTANGIPAGIVEVPAWSSACAKHDAYERANGGQLTHQEDMASPGYTAEGAWAGAHAVLAAGASWAAGNPWKTAPIHLAQLLSPRLAAIGIDDAADLSCATTFPGYTRPDPATDVTYTFPGNGTTGVPASEVAREGPFTPGQQVGIAAGATTGPYLYVFFDGPGIYYSGGASQVAKLTSATLTGPAGPVAVRIADNTTPGLAGYLPTGGQVIPLAPLSAHTIYTAHVTGALVSTPARTFDHTWAFRSAGTATIAPKLKLRAPRRAGRHVRAVLRADPALVGRPATLTIRKLRRRCPTCAAKPFGKTRRRTITLTAKRTLTFALPAHRAGFRLKIVTAAFTVGEDHFTAARASAKYLRR